MKNERLQQTMQKKVYCEQLYGKTMANLEGMDRFLEKFDLGNLNFTKNVHFFQVIHFIVI